jgi:hypothetical protein
MSDLDARIPALDAFQLRITENLRPLVRDLLEEHGGAIATAMFGEVFGTPVDRVEPLKQPSRDGHFILRLTTSFTEIGDSFDHLLDAEVYLRRFPFRNSRVTPATYVRYHFENYLQETYILYNRLVALARWVQHTYRKTRSSARVEKAVARVLDMLKFCFEPLLTARGVHVHEARLDEFPLRRLSLLDMASQEMPEFGPTYDQAQRRVRRERAAWIRANNDRLRIVMNTYFEQLHPLLFTPAGRARYPSPPRAG